MRSIENITTHHGIVLFRIHEVAWASELVMNHAIIIRASAFFFSPKIPQRFSHAVDAKTHFPLITHPVHSRVGRVVRTPCVERFCFCFQTRSLQLLFPLNLKDITRQT